MCFRNYYLTKDQTTCLYITAKKTEYILIVPQPLLYPFENTASDLLKR